MAGYEAGIAGGHPHVSDGNAPMADGQPSMACVASLVHTQRMSPELCVPPTWHGPWLT